jgi:hypothetical protein
MTDLTRKEVEYYAKGSAETYGPAAMVRTARALLSAWDALEEYEKYFQQAPAGTWRNCLWCAGDQRSKTMDWQAIHVTSEIFQWLALAVVIWLLRGIDKSAAEALGEIERYLREESKLPKE